MNYSITLARTAREFLGGGLGALQAPDVPPDLMRVVESIARSMRALHEIESSEGGLARELASTALVAIRHALGSLQDDPSGHPAVGQAVEAVAGALGAVHELSTQFAGPQGRAEAAGPVCADASVRGGRITQGCVPAAAESDQSHGRRRPRQGRGALEPAHPPTAPQHAFSRDLMVAMLSAGAEPKPREHDIAPPPDADEKLVEVDAALGAFSASNFYSGFDGTDVVESGGIFIATYRAPKVGQRVRIRLSMPGGYQFDAKAVVRWIRDVSPSAPPASRTSAAPPGFGAQFTHISREGWQLVNRYVRNREPIFHDT